MKVRYFPDTDTLLVTFSEQPIVDTRDLNEDVLVDRQVEVHDARGCVEVNAQGRDTAVGGEPDSVRPSGETAAQIARSFADQQHHTIL